MNYSVNNATASDAVVPTDSVYGILQNFGSLLSETFTLTKLRRHFYLVTPEETIFPDVKSVPNYVDQAFPYFMVFIAIEFLVLFAGDDEDRKPRLNGKFSCYSQASVMLIFLCPEEQCRRTGQRILSAQLRQHIFHYMTFFVLLSTDTLTSMSCGMLTISCKYVVHVA